MKSRLGFLLPRLVGVTLLVGLAALVLGLVFKLLLFAVLLGAIVMGVAGLVHYFNHNQSRRGISNPKNWQRNKYANKTTIVPIH